MLASGICSQICGTSAFFHTTSMLFHTTSVLVAVGVIIYVPCNLTNTVNALCAAGTLMHTLVAAAAGVNCRHSGGCGKRQETMHSIVYTPGGRGKRQETMLCSVTTPKLIY
jgi:hypothetical protein